MSFYWKWTYKKENSQFFNSLGKNSSSQMILGSDSERLRMARRMSIIPGFSLLMYREIMDMRRPAVTRDIMGCVGFPKQVINFSISESLSSELSKASKASSTTPHCWFTFQF